MSSDELSLRPIGHIRCGKTLKFNARHQPNERLPETNVLELIPGDKYVKALKDLAGFDRIWLLMMDMHRRSWQRFYCIWDWTFRTICRSRSLAQIDCEQQNLVSARTNDGENV